MKTAAPSASAYRLARLRSGVTGAGLDALVVSNLTNVRYLTGFRGTAGTLFVSPRHATLIVDFRYAVAARAATSASPLDVVVAGGPLDDELAGVIRASGCRRIGIEGQSMTVARFNRLSALVGEPRSTQEPSIALVATERIVERERATKDSSEVALIREAARRLGTLALDVAELAQPGRTELEVAADIDRRLREAGFERPAFETIVASGPNGALPHARPTNRTLELGDGVVLDFGGVYEGYCVDLTRTVQLGGPSGELARIMVAVADAQAAAIEAVRPGVRCSDVDAAARSVLDARGLGGAFGHATGHGLGLDVHEEPRVARRTEGQPDAVLEPGMVFTIEPGAYVEGLGGVRIEDDVLVTDTGCEVLTRPAGGLNSLARRGSEADWS